MDENIILPPTLALSSEKLESSGMFLLDDGLVMHLWIGGQVAIEQLQQLFGVNSLDQVDPNIVRPCGVAAG